MDVQGVDPGVIRPSDAGFYQCGRCHRHFSRPDHLSRHIRTHTLERPYRCSVCGKAFARADLLKRHALNHSDEATKRRRLALNKPPSSRVRQACKACAASKVKCNEAKPCQRCQQRAIPCEYTYSTLESDDEDEDLTDTIEIQSYPDSIRPVDMELPEDALPGSQNMEIQIPTPGTSINQDANSVPVMMETSFADFLKDVLLPDSHEGGSEGMFAMGGTGFSTPANMPDLNIAIDRHLNDWDIGSVDLFDNDFMRQIMGDDPDFTTCTQPTTNEEPQPGASPEEVAIAIAAGAKAFERSVWRWSPAYGHDGVAWKSTLPWPANAEDAENLPPPSGIPAAQRLEKADRDKILSMILSSCDRAHVPRIVSSFPSAEFLESVLHGFLRAHRKQWHAFVHIPTLETKLVRPELLAAMVAEGAGMASIRPIQNLGYSIQEVLRLAIPLQWEKENSLTRDLQLLQAYALHLFLGFWSGDKRRMEIAESFEQPIVTMLRRAGAYSPAKYKPVVVKDDDEGAILDQKWRWWVEQESFKRLAYRIFIHNAQSSMALLVNPLIAYSELLLPFPCPDAFWQADSATRWKALYLPSEHNSFANPPASFFEGMRKILNRNLSPGIMQVPSSTARLILYGLWGLVWDYRKMELFLDDTIQAHGRESFLLPVRHQAIVSTLQDFKLAFSSQLESSHPTPTSPPAYGSTDCMEMLVLLEFLLLSLHTPLEKLQIFAGKDGELEAQSVYPLLHAWTATREARQGIWHAGQVLRTIKALLAARVRLRDFWAVVVYHASLTIWVWSIINGAVRLREAPYVGVEPLLPGEKGAVVYLDGEDGPPAQRFVALQQGLPGFTGVEKDDEALLSSPARAMEVVNNILMRCVRGEAVPPLVENIGQLIRELGAAAKGIGLA